MARRGMLIGGFLTMAAAVGSLQYLVRRRRRRVQAPASGPPDAQLSTEERRDAAEELAQRIDEDQDVT